MKKVIDFLTCRVSVSVLAHLYIMDLQKLEYPMTEEEIESSLRSQGIRRYAIREVISRARALIWQDGEPYFAPRPEIDPDKRKAQIDRAPLFSWYESSSSSEPENKPT